ncbi:D-3-phosphoglycerate dehydrogenase [Humitalea rosea]|uniref:D-3-phosphoglycerate dehydrogenase n=1 Tax=Humitalea rosea TaxID=990373 RepID=A0A2W7I9R1_9PROT|nr:2-hydroxyacid dehydrogenase [Humitalea rosea]PZW43631.1 D-3-phosphoglycerate dehydrogenase [Humitalea rosea]
MSEKIAMLQPISDDQAKLIRSLLAPGFEITRVNGRGIDDLKAAVADATYAVWWDVGVPDEVMAAGPKLKLIHKWGVGIDNIDIPAAQARGIQIARTTGSNATAVAEFTVGVLVALARRIVPAHLSTSAGGWEKNEISRRSIIVSGKTVGIIGMGAIGQQVAKRLAAFGCPILYHNRNRLPAAEEAALGATWRPLDALLAESDFITLNCPLTPQTKGMIDARAFGLMKRGALLVNVARGGVVVEADMAEALRDGTLAGAAVDVFEQEPPPADHPFLHRDNVIVTPHSASTAHENAARGIKHWLGNIERVARGEEIPAQDRVA